MIILATPTRDSITAGTTANIVALCRHRPDVKFIAPLGIYIANLRNYTINFAKQVGASHVLFADTDMRFPADALDRLLKRTYDVMTDTVRQIIAANYVQRTMSEWWVARLDGESVSSEGRIGVQQVDSVGCGLMLIDMSIFDRLAAPWFSSPWDGQDHIGEDLFFCQQATRAGIPVWIDHDLSQLVRHQGTVEHGVGKMAPLAAVS